MHNHTETSQEIKSDRLTNLQKSKINVHFVYILHCRVEDNPVVISKYRRQGNFIDIAHFIQKQFKCFKKANESIRTSKTIWSQGEQNKIHNMKQNEIKNI